MIKRAWIAGLCLTGAFALSPIEVQASHEDFAVYEDWRSAPTIRSDRWSGVIDSAQEVERRIHGRRLVMRYRKAGLTFLNVGFINAFHRLTTANPFAIDQLEADVKVQRIEVSGCSANPEPTLVVPVALTLTKFNDGTAGSPGNSTGDHLARIRVLRDAASSEPEGVLAVQGFLFRCGDAACIGGTFVFQVNVATVTVGERFTLRLIWDAANHQFIYGVGDLNIPVVYLPARNARRAFGEGADLRMQSRVANCTSNPTQTDARITVREIRTNASAVIP